MRVKAGDYIYSPHRNGKVVYTDGDYAYVKLPLTDFLRQFTDVIGINMKDITKVDKFKAYEVMWWIDDVDYYERFETRKQALAFYFKHENDPDKKDMQVTKRDINGNFKEDII